jgi:hypothetical protein
MMRAVAYMSAAALLVGSALMRPARADDAIDAWASWALAPKIWKGQTVPVPPPTARPSRLGLTVDSLELPLRVHAPARDRRSARAAMLALERAYLAARGFGWPSPPFDADLGGSPAFDLYLVPGASPGADAQVDEERAPSDFDAAVTYAIVSAKPAGAQLAACVQSAFAQATARALEPAESASVVRATGEYSAYLETGEPGCDDSFARGQNAAERSMLGTGVAAAGSGGLFLAMLSERHEGGSGEFVRKLWELARQRSKGLVADDRLRGSPDVWEVIARALELTEAKWSDEIAEFAVARFFAGEQGRRAAAAYRVFAELPSDAGVPLLADLQEAQLPRHVRTDPEGGVEPLGSVYVRLQLAEAGRCARGACELRVWLRGELGPRWLLSAVRLDERGRELGRTSAPPREVPQAYLPLALSPDTRQVIVVVTNLPRATPDADLGEPVPRGLDLAFELQ